VLLGDCAPDRVGDLPGISPRVERPALHLVDHDEPLLSLLFNGERRAASGA